MKILIFGLGTLGGGFSAAKYFLDRQDEVRITDLRSEAVLGTPLAILKSHGATAIVQEHRKEDFIWADIVIKNPAVAANNPLLECAKRVETDITFLFSSALLKGIDIIAITGTKGKTTTAAAVSHVLNSNGHEAIQCGNMGISGFSVLSETAVFSYKCDRFYHPDSERSIHPFDSAIGIDWQLGEIQTLVSGKDMKAPFFKEAEMNFKFGSL